MNNRAVICEAIEARREEILAAERQLWKHPETGYREWKTHAYLKGLYEQLGYRVTAFGNIPGFFVDIETGRPGPRLAVFGEMDALLVPTHPACDPETGAVHACGHNCQSAALYGIAAGLAAPGALEGLAGSIRLIAAPAEELIEFDYRQSLIDKGTIHFFGGKQELLARGILDDVDLSLMVHTMPGGGISFTEGSNGCVIKRFIFTGQSAHAGGAPDKGVNALYAAELAMSAANALRETFRDDDHVRFHPIITEGGSSVNSIPDRVTVEAYLRAASMEAMTRYNRAINRAFAASAAAIVCGLRIIDRHGYAPRVYDPVMTKAAAETAEELVPQEKIRLGAPFSGGCSDMGDVSAVMPVIHPHIGGLSGSLHGSDLQVEDPYFATVVSAKLQALTAVRLLENDAALAKKAVAEARPEYGSIAEYLGAVEKLDFSADAVRTEEDGRISLKYKP